MFTHKHPSGCCYANESRPVAVQDCRLSFCTENTGSKTHVLRFPLFKVWKPKNTAQPLQKNNVQGQQPQQPQNQTSHVISNFIEFTTQQILTQIPTQDTDTETRQKNTHKIEDVSHKTGTHMSTQNCSVRRTRTTLTFDGKAAQTLICNER